MKKFTSIALAVVFAITTSWCSADILFQSNFTGLTDGPIDGQEGWNAQASWEVDSVAGMVSNSGSWQRCKHTTSGFMMSPDDVVRMTVEFSVDGMAATGSEVARFGFARDDETPGQNTPQVFAAVNWNGTELSVGGAVDPNYDPGDVIQASLTFTMLPSTNGWQATSRISNLTDGTNFEAGFSPADSAGTASMETCWEWLNMGNGAQFSFRTYDNATGGTVAVDAIVLENNLPPDQPIAEVIYDVNFCDLNLAPLDGQDGWEAQPDWVVTGGMANANGSWSRARQLTPVTMAVGDQVRVTASMSFTDGGMGAPGADNFTIGFAKNNEHTGATLPQVEAAANWSGTTLTFGGATDPAYDSGDELLVTMLFTREAAMNTWSLETTLENVTDGTSFTGSTSPTDDPGTVSAETCWEWLESGQPAFFGLRQFDNPTEAVTSIKTLLVEKNPPADGKVIKGDVNQDSAVNLLDVGPFVSLLSNNQYQAEADVNCDGVLNLLDVGPFVDLLSGGG